MEYLLPLGHRFHSFLGFSLARNVADTSNTTIIFERELSRMKQLESNRDSQRNDDNPELAGNLHDAIANFNRFSTIQLHDIIFIFEYVLTGFFLCSLL